jgi:hypothetical protein
MSVKFLAQGNNDLPLTGFESMWLTIIKLLVRLILKYNIDFFIGRKTIIYYKIIVTILINMNEELK